MLESLKSKEAENSSINASRQGSEEDCTALQVPYTLQQAQLKLACRKTLNAKPF